MNRMMLSSLLTIAAATLAGGEISVRVSKAPKSVVAALPFTICGEVTAPEGAPVLFAEWAGMGYEIRDAHGGVSCRNRVNGYTVKRAGERLEAGEKKENEFLPLEVDGCRLTPGTYILTVHVVTTPCKEKCPKLSAWGEKSWKGEMTSEPVSLVILEPQGADKEAYDAYNGWPMARMEELMWKYPGSIYAWHLMWEAGTRVGEYASLSEMDRLSRLKSIGCSTLRPLFGDGKTPLSPKEYEASEICIERAKKYLMMRVEGVDVLLKAHPDYEHRKEAMRYKVDTLLVLGREKEAREAARELAVAGDPEIIRIFPELERRR